MHGAHYNSPPLILQWDTRSKMNPSFQIALVTYKNRLPPRFETWILFWNGDRLRYRKMAVVNGVETGICVCHAVFFESKRLKGVCAYQSETPVMRRIISGSIPAVAISLAISSFPSILPSDLPLA